MKRIAATLLTAIFCASSIDLAFAGPAPTIRATASGDSAVKLSITLSKEGGKPTLVRIERSTAGGAFQAVGEFSRPKLKFSHTDRFLSEARHSYRARVLSPKRSKWSSRANVTLGDSPTSPTPTPTSGGSYFDSNGNVTSAGKTVLRIPSSLSANISSGQSIWNSTCAPCHSARKNGRDYVTLKSALPADPMYLTVSDQNVAHLAAYLNEFRTP